MLGFVGERGVQFPAQTVVERQVRLDLPAILGKKIKTGVADIFHLSRTLSELIRKAKQIIRIEIVGSHVIGATAVVGEGSIHVVIVELVELLLPEVSAEFVSVAALNFRDGVSPLERVADLRQFALGIVADGESARDGDERKTFP